MLFFHYYIKNFLFYQESRKNLKKFAYEGLRRSGSGYRFFIMLRCYVNLSVPPVKSEVSGIDRSGKIRENPKKIAYRVEWIADSARVKPSRAAQVFGFRNYVYRLCQPKAAVKLCKGIMLTKSGLQRPTTARRFYVNFHLFPVAAVNIIFLLPIISISCQKEKRTCVRSLLVYY